MYHVSPWQPFSCIDRGRRKVVILQAHDSSWLYLRRQRNLLHRTSNVSWSRFLISTKAVESPPQIHLSPSKASNYLKLFVIVWRNFTNSNVKRFCGFVDEMIISEFDISRQ